jgi:hypothetical protein
MSALHVRNAFAVTALFLSLSAVALADVVSGPTVGSKPEAFKVVIVTGDEAGKEVDVIEKMKDKPQVFVFVAADKFDRPMARFMKTLDQELSEKRPDLRIVAVWLTDDVNKSKEYLPKADQSLKFKHTVLSVFPKDKNGPDNWGINSDAHLTAVLVSSNLVDASVGYRSLNETDVPDLIKKLKPAK